MKKKKINVLSLFDGISCARVALDRAGFEVDRYYASEIDKYALQISQKNYPNIIQLGDVKEVLRLFSKEHRYFNTEGTIPEFDLLIGGSPCQDLSIAKNNRKGLEGDRSGLFWEYVRILKEVKPKYFILENVASMPKEAKEKITETLGVEPIMINAALVSAQNRKRLFWTNIPNVTRPEDKKIMLGDIILPADQIEEKYWYSHPLEIRGMDRPVCALLDFKIHDMNKRVFNPAFKCATLTTCKGGNLQKKVLQNNRARKLTPLEYERLQGLPDNYTAGFADSHRYNTVGNAFNVDVVAHILSFIK